MFTAKQKQLFSVKEKQTTSVSLTNGFLNAAKKKQSQTLSGNGSAKFSTTGDEFVDQFGKLGEYKTPRSYGDIANNMATLWAKNAFMCVCFVLYIRMITRIVSLFSGDKTQSVQRGAGLRHEGIIRMMWLNINHRDTFWKNISLFISVGSWKDVIAMLSYDLQYYGWKDKQLDWDNFGKLLLAGLENPNTSELVKKYLPQIKTNSKCNTLEAQADNMIAKWICSLLFGGKDGDTNYQNYKKYRKLKSAGTAHQWQQLISQGKHSLINFNSIHGRALSQLVSGKYLANNGLEQEYAKWIENKPVAKFTGYVYELAALITNGIKKYQIDTINAQYNQLLLLAGKTNGGFIVVKDSSGSMDSKAHGTTMSSYHVAKSLSIFLGNMLQGHFHNHYIDFSSRADLREIQGSNFIEHWNTEKRLLSADTNFLAVARLFASILQSGVPQSEFPSGIICVSDGEFNRTGMYNTTNVEAFKQIMLQAGFTREFVNSFKFCFWDIHNSFYGSQQNTKFELFGPAENIFYFSGFDPSVITFLTGQEGSDKALPKNAQETFQAAMNQEVLSMIEI